MNRSGVVPFSLALAMFWLWVFAQVRDQHHPAMALAAQVQGLKHEIEKQRLQKMALADEYLSFRESVASVLPLALPKAKDRPDAYPIRRLASVVSRTSGAEVKEALAQSMFESAKRLFRERQYSRANAIFNKLIDRYGYLPEIVEAHFLLVEGQFQLGDHGGMSRSIDRMVSQFPGSELTGLALLRLGQLLQSRERFAEAVDLYRTVLKTFPQRNVAQQAEKNLRELEF